MSRAFLRAAVVCAVLGAASYLPWARLARELRERRAEREALAPMLAEAKRLNLTFPQVVVAHPSYAGKPVYWDVNVLPSSMSTSGYVSGRSGWPIIWTNPKKVHAVMMTYQQERVLARVAAVKEDVVYLEFLGKP